MVSPSSEQENGAEVVAKRLCVLKFGSSVLERRRIILVSFRRCTVTSGMAKRSLPSCPRLPARPTLCLQRRAGSGGEVAPDALVARLARTGELQSAALLALALSKGGLRAWTLDPHEMALVAEGSPLDSNLRVDSAAVWAMIDANDVVVVPGFIADHNDHGVVTLGRGGTDLSAVFFADRLDAHRSAPDQGCRRRL